MFMSPANPHGLAPHVGLRWSGDGDRSSKTDLIRINPENTTTVRRRKKQFPHGKRVRGTLFLRKTVISCKPEASGMQSSGKSSSLDRAVQTRHERLARVLPHVSPTGGRCRGCLFSSRDGGLGVPSADSPRNRRFCPNMTSRRKFWWRGLDVSDWQLRPHAGTPATS